VSTKFSELSPRERAAAVAVGAVAVVIVVTAERDLHQRPADEIRGGKWIWRVVCLNAVGALAYLGWGRRR
jgi:hypothetical protein